MAAWLPPEEQIRVRFPAEARVVLVAQLADRPLHTRKAQGSIPCENLLFFGLVRGRSCVQSAQRTRLFRPVFVVRYGVVGNMSGSHPVASGSIPGIGSVGLLRSLSSVGRASA